MNRPMLLSIAGLSVVAVVVTKVLPPRPVLLWNLTGSAPVGLYRLRQDAPIQRGDWVAVAPPGALVPMLAARRYLPAGVPLVKRVAAVAPSRVCRDGSRILLDGRARALARPKDRMGRALPIWRGCHTLDPGEVFLLNAARDSLDGRYFGPTSRRDLLGRLTPLWLVAEAAP